MNEITAGVQQAIAYEEGYAAGKKSILYEIADILDVCAHDNGAMIVRELKALMKEYGVK